MLASAEIDGGPARSLGSFGGGTIAEEVGESTGSTGVAGATGNPQFGGAHAGPTSSPMGGAPPEGMGGIPGFGSIPAPILPTDPSLCVSAKFVRERGSYVYSREEFDPNTRILAEIATDPPDFTAVSSRYFSLYDAQGRRLVSGTDGSDPSGVSRSDYRYNPQGDLIEATHSNPATLELPGTPGQPETLFGQYSHEYDDLGRLVATNCTLDKDGSILLECTGFVRQTYLTDARGDCAEIGVTALTVSNQELVSHSYVIRQEYDAAHRLVRSESLPSSGGYSYHTIAEYTYDAQGRILSREVDGGSRGAADGQPDWISAWRYATDGASYNESWDFASASPNEEVVRDGQLVAVEHGLVARSAGCVPLDDSVRPLHPVGCHYVWSWGD